MVVDFIKFKAAVQTPLPVTASAYLFFNSVISL